MASKYKKKEPPAKIPFPEKIKLSEFQENIKSGWIGHQVNMMINAVAGAGKSFVVAMLCHLDPDRSPALYSSFMTSIVNEMIPKLPDWLIIKGAHALGNSAIANAYGVRPNVNIGKYKIKNYIEQKLNYMADKNDPNSWDRVSNGVNLISKIKLTMTDPHDAEGIILLCDIYDISIDCVDKFLKDIPAIMAENDRLAMQGVIDFDDMIYMVVKYDLNVPYYKRVFIDEAQDFSPLMQAFMAKFVHPIGGKILVVGDPKQCQPPGTQVLMDHGGWCNIEDVKVGDRVTSYNTKYGQMVKGQTVTKVGSRPFSGLMTEVEAGGDKSPSTPNHKWYVKWSMFAKDKHVVYLMRKGNQFRIGVSPLFTKRQGAERGSTGFGPAARAIAEGADSLWILGYYNSSLEARVWENKYSYKYCVPQTMWKYNNSPKLKMTQEEFDDFWDYIGDNSAGAIKLLSELDLEIEHPFWSNRNNNHMGITSSFFIRACNLVDGLFLVPRIDKYTERKGNLDWNMVNIHRFWYQGMVHSLEVNRDETYVADGLLTGNSIMGFAGADCNAMTKMKELFDCKELPLSVCYRCHRGAITEAQKLVPHIMPHDNAIEGEVRFYQNEAEKFEWSNVHRQSMILCRRNAPLVKPAFKLLREGIKATIKGQKLGEGLIKLINQILPKGGTCIELMDAVEVWKEKKIAEILGRKNINLALIENTEDKAEVISSFCDGCIDSIEVQFKIKRIFDDDTTEGVVLSTAHRSKGLEAKNVYILDYNNIEIKRDTMSEDARQQERNLHYVSLTRPKEFLGLLP